MPEHMVQDALLPRPKATEISTGTDATLMTFIRNTEVLILVPARLLTDLRLVLEGRGVDDECSRHFLHRMMHDTFLIFYCIDSLS